MTVDGFQGREKGMLCTDFGNWALKISKSTNAKDILVECIIISLVRSNSNGEVGFLRDQRRLNVAITRARRHLCIVGDSHTVTRDPFIKGLYTWFEDEGRVRAPE